MQLILKDPMFLHVINKYQLSIQQASSNSMITKSVQATFIKALVHRQVLGGEKKVNFFGLDLHFTFPEEVDDSKTSSIFIAGSLL